MKPWLDDLPGFYPFPAWDLEPRPRLPADGSLDPSLELFRSFRTALRMVPERDREGGTDPTPSRSDDGRLGAGHRCREQNGTRHVCSV